MAKYKVGDVVTLRADLRVNYRYGKFDINSTMVRFAGNDVVIDKVFDEGYYKIKGSSWNWDDEMIVGLSKSSKPEIHRRICLGLNDLYTQKNKEYGDSFGKAFHDMGMISPIVDMYHKLQRIISIHDKHGGDVKFESVEDSLRDLANYAIMTLVELENKK